MLTIILQWNILHWEIADPQWELPEYIDDVMLDLMATKVWITTGGLGPDVTVLLVVQGPKAADEGESEVESVSPAPKVQLF